MPAVRPREGHGRLRSNAESFQAAQSRRSRSNAWAHSTLVGCTSSFEQLLANLILNGDQATADDAPVEVVLEASRHAVTIQVIDFGTGISPTDLNRIWEPLYTTKQAGSGLGLLVVKEAVAAFNGDIAVTSSAGKGTCFSIRLPVPI